MIRDDLSADFLSVFEQRAYQRSEAAQYEREQADLDADAARQRNDQAGRDYLKGLGLGDSLPPPADYDYGRMLADGVHPRPDEQGRLPLPPRYFRPGQLILDGVDVPTGKRIASRVPLEERILSGDLDGDGEPDDPDAILDTALDDPASELTPAERASLTAWREQRQRPLMLAANTAGQTTRTDVPVAELRAGRAGPRERWQDGIASLLMAAGMDERRAVQKARDMVGMHGGIGVADFDPVTMGHELDQAVGEGRYLDAALLALGLSVFAKPAAKAARGVVNAAVSGPAAGSRKAQIGAVGDLNEISFGPMPARAPATGKVADKFDTETLWLHGTTQDIKSFRPSKSGELGPGIYLTQSPLYANAWAHAEGGNVMPLVIRKGDLFDMGAFGRLWNSVDGDRFFVDMAQRIQANPARMPAIARDWADQPTADFAQHIKRTYRQGEPINTWLDRAGYVGAFNKDSQIADQVVVFDPRNIRSVNARFAKEGSKNIMAGAAGATVAVGAAGMGASGDADASWLSVLVRSSKITHNMSKHGIIEAAKSQGATRVSEQTAENVLKALRGEIEPVRIQVGPAAITEGDGLSHGFYYMAANEDRVHDVMRTLGLKPGADPVANLKVVLNRWKSMPSRMDGNRLIFGMAAPGQRATGMILDQGGNPMTAFTIVYGGKK